MKPRVRIQRVWHFLAKAGLAGALFVCASCGSGNTSGGDFGGSGTLLPDTPFLTAISPTSATAQSASVGLTLHGSNFENNAIVQFNGTAIPSSWVSSTLMTAAVPSSDVATAGIAKVTVTNPTPGGGTSTAQAFTVVAAPVSATWVRTVTGISVPQDIVWDAAHGMLYVSVGPTDTAAPNTIIALNPVTGTAAKTVAAGNNPDLLTISSDSSYLWAGLDGDNAVQRFLLPGLTKDISFPLPLDWGGNPQQAVSLQAAPVSPHALALVAGHWSYSPLGDGVHIYDDATERPISVPGWGPFGGPMIDWIQWGANDSTIYGNQYTTADAGGVATMKVTSSGVSFAAYNGGQIGPGYTQYDSNKGLLYSTGSYFFGRTFNPVDGGVAGTFRLPELGRMACTADSSLDRYYCIDAHALAGSLFQFELLVLDLNTYALLDRVNFGATAGEPLSPITGAPWHLVRWGNAGLALNTETDGYYGNGGAFLIDGSVVNPNAAPDVSTGAPVRSFSWMRSLAPQQASAGSGAVTLTINGNHFTPNSAACWNCNSLQFQFLPTTYVSPEQISVTIPANLLTSPTTLPISVFDSDSGLFSTNSLTFSVMSASSSNTKVTAVDLAGFAMAWDPHSALLYVGTANFDGAYPNSIVAVDAETGSVVKSQTVGSDPDLVSVSTNGQYIYAAFAGATTMTQLQLPNLGSQRTWTLTSPGSSAAYTAGDMRTAPVSPNTTAITLFDLQSFPWEIGGVVIYDDNMQRADFINGWGPGLYPPTAYDTLAWGPSDQVLTGACSSGCLSNTPVSPLYKFQITPSGAALVGAGTSAFNQGEIHSDFVTGLIYSDDGYVADPNTQAIVGTYSASGLVAPDSSLNRTFILGQTVAQANTNNFTIESFDEKAYTPVSSITVDNIVGAPIECVRWGNSGLAVLTINGGSGSQGMLYLIQDTTFVSSARAAASEFSKPQETVQQRWKRLSKADILKTSQAGVAARQP